MDGRAPYAEALRNLTGGDAFRLQRQDLIGLAPGRRLTPLVFPLRLGSGNARTLAFKHQLALERGDARHHREQQLAGRGGRIDVHGKDANHDAVPIQVLDDPQQIDSRTSKPIRFRHNERVPVPEVVQGGPELGPLGVNAGHLFAEDTRTRHPFEFSYLIGDARDLIDGRAPTSATTSTGVTAPDTTMS